MATVKTEDEFETYSVHLQQTVLNSEEHVPLRDLAKYCLLQLSRNKLNIAVAFFNLFWGFFFWSYQFYLFSFHSVFFTLNGSNFPPLFKLNS